MLHAEQITEFLISIGTMLLVARVLAEVCTYFNQPSIIGEIFAGILLGPTVLGALSPDLFAYVFPSDSAVKTVLEGITTLAVVMLLLVIGLEVDLSLLLRHRKAAFYTSIIGTVFPFMLGSALAYHFPEMFGAGGNASLLVFALFVGTAMSISALPVIARTLMDMNMLKSQIGLIIIASAMFGDLLGWIIFSVILGMMGTGSPGNQLGTTVLLLGGFVLIMLIPVRRLINRAVPFLQTKISYPGGILNFIFILGFFCAAFTEWLGVHAIFGAFIVGVAIGDSAHLSEKTKEILHQFVTNIFAPLFFVSIGLKVDFFANFSLPLVLTVLTIAIIAKVIGAGLGAYLGGLNVKDSAAVGFGMNSRGAMEIILGILAFQAGLINEQFFVALVVMALVTSIISGPMMKWILSYKNRFSVQQLVTAKTVYYSTAPAKKELLRELAGFAARQFNLDEQEVYIEVLKREDLLPTGMGNFLAIPHAKITTSRPFIAVAVHKEGIDFEATDGLPAKVILLLLTPKNQNELQLGLLASIANVFRNKEVAGKLLEVSTPKEFAQLFHRFSAPKEGQ